MKAKFTFDVHPTEDALEAYALKRLPEVKTLEEHLLMCGDCQDLLEKTDEYILLMKCATAGLNSRARGLEWRRVKSSYAVLGAVTLAVVFLGSLMSKPGRPESPDVPVELTALRGGDVTGMAHGLAGRPTEFAMDVSDLPDVNQFRLELVTSSGRRTWEGGAVPSKAGKLSVRVPKDLRQGVYWVRLYTQDNQLLREFGFRAD